MTLLPHLLLALLAAAWPQTSAAAANGAVQPPLLEFPRPAAAAACPSFSRYVRLHRAALGQPLLLPGFMDFRHLHHRHHLHHGQALTHGSQLHSTGPNHVESTGSSFLTSLPLDKSDIKQDSSSQGKPRSRRSLSADAATDAAHAGSSSATATAQLASGGAAGGGADGGLPRARVRWLVTADPDGIADRLVNAVSSFYYALLTDRVLCIRPASAEQPGLDAAFSAPNIDFTCRGAPSPFPDTVEWNPTKDDAWMDPHFGIYSAFVRSDLNAIGPYNATTIDLRMHRGLTVALFNNPHHSEQLTRMGLRPDTAFGCAVQFLFGLQRHTQQLAAADPRLHAAMVDERAIKIGIQIRLGDDKILDQIERSGEVALDDSAQGVVEGFFRCAEALEGSIRLLSDPETPDERTARQADGEAARQGAEAAAAQQGEGAAEQAEGTAGQQGGGGSQQAGKLRRRRRGRRRSARAMLAEGGEGGEAAGGGGSEGREGQEGAEGDDSPEDEQLEPEVDELEKWARPEPRGPPLRIYYYLMTDTLAVRTWARERYGDKLLALSDEQVAVQFYQDVTPDGLRRTALEHWYFARCHHHIITGHSGMGRTAAFASLRPGPSLFSMEILDGVRSGGASCEVWDADRPLAVYNTWSGV